mgnify:CR=1 FL=1
MQDDIFWDGEADQYFARNQAALTDPGRTLRDPVLRMIESVGLRPRRVLEVGCANGWRLEALRQRYSCRAFGIEPSSDAIRDGCQRYPRVRLFRGSADDMPFRRPWFDLVIVAFCFHWVAREHLFQSVAEIDRVLATDGCLIINDFAPRWPTKTRYRHCEGVNTYKQAYHEIFLASVLYASRSERVYDYETGLPGFGIAERRRAVCALLKKGARYQVCE